MLCTFSGDKKLSNCLANKLQQQHYLLLENHQRK